MSVPTSDELRLAYALPREVRERMLDVPAVGFFCEAGYSPTLVHRPVAPRRWESPVAWLPIDPVVILEVGRSLLARAGVAGVEVSISRTADHEDRGSYRAMACGCKEGQSIHAPLHQARGTTPRAAALALLTDIHKGA
jgi:hypothetical protein